MTAPIAALVPNADIPGVAQLAELALDLRSTWNHSADELWGRLDPELWALTHSPWVVLQTVARTRLLEALREPTFHRRLESLVEERRTCLTSPAWFQQHHPDARLGCVAYFSMEFGLSEALPIYSGGLGNVAGDQLKTAHDLGVPVVGIGLLYQQGYFRQVIEPDGSQRALYPQNSPSFLPVTPVREADGEWLRLAVATHGRKVFLRAWQAQVGRTTLYLLDANDPANSPADRGITSELYGGGPALRLTQEIALGIGGWYLLRRLGLRPDVCHLNEGHAAFAVLERARGFMEDTGQPFDVALAVTRAGNLFTTHTPVAAGFDRFDAEAIGRTLGGYARKALGISVDQLLALGRERPSDPSEPFNMAYLAIRGSLAVNGVSRLHGSVSRSLFQSLFPRWPTTEVPIDHVTNGVHVPTWDSEAADALWTRACGKDRWIGTQEGLEAQVRTVADVELWALRNDGRRLLLGAVRERLANQLAAAGAPAQRDRRRQDGLLGRRADPGLRPPLRHLQAAEPAAARPRSPAAPADERRATGAARRRRQGASRRSRRAGDGEGVDRVHPPAAKRPVTSSSSPTTTCCWPSSSCRASTSGSTRRAGPGKPAAPAA